MSEPVQSASPRHHTAIKIIVGVIAVPIAIFIILLAAGFVLNVFDRSDRISRGDYTVEQPAVAEPSTPAYTDEQRASIEGQRNYTFGPDDAPVTIVEFSDFACPFCLASFPALREASLKYKDDVRIVFRDWPGHEHSINLAMAAYCAGEQGKFWDMHDKLFQNQSETFGSDKAQLTALAGQLGIDNPQFSSCVDTQKYLPQIRTNFAASQTLGVRGTPTWFINGEKIEGALNATELDALITKHLE